MNGYELSRKWFNFAFDNPDKVSVTQTALYMWLIEQNNWDGWVEKFAFNTSDACKYIGVSNRKTVWKALNELVELGFVKIIFKSSNQQKPSVISLKVPQIKTSGALDRALRQSKKRTTSETADGLAEEQHADSLGNSSETADGHSYKPKTSKPKTIKEPQTNQQSPALPDYETSFEEFWNLYDLKKEKPKALKLWDSLKQAKRDAALKHVPLYVASTPDKKYRKHPVTYLRGECWNDEIIPATTPNGQRTAKPTAQGLNISKQLEDQAKKVYR